MGSKEEALEELRGAAGTSIEISAVIAWSAERTRIETKGEAGPNGATSHGDKKLKYTLLKRVVVGGTD